MSKFLNSDLAELAHQLTLSPRRLCIEQIRGVETVLGMIESDRAYPFDLVCFHVTGYRKRASDTSPLIPAKALMADLVTLAEQLSRRAGLQVAELGEPFKTHQELADELQVSTKTVRRWRTRGLMGIRAVFEDGVGRLAFLQRTIDRFIKQNQDLVARGASFKQLTKIERDHLVTRARELLSKDRLKLHAVARIISEETGRAVETIRYTLRRYEESDEGQPLFVSGGEWGACEHEVAVWRCHQAGESTASIARALDCSCAEIEQTLRSVQAKQWKDQPLGCVHNELFDAPNADALILEVDEPTAPEAKPQRVPRDLPSYLRSLYQTPLLSREQEADLFRRYNYVKWKVQRAVAGLEPETVSCDQIEGVSTLLKQVDAFRKRLTQANLRLVVSIAKRHVGWSASFYEVISDGNVSLMRAIEKFDYARGNKFSTYGSWAIIKNYARSIPEAHYHGKRYVTGQDELLSAAADQSEVVVGDGERAHVRKAIAAGLSQLDEREREIVAGHFGLGSQGKPLTLEQLGKRFGVTKERIRQIERRALTRLRSVLSPSLADALSA